MTDMEDFEEKLVSCCSNDKYELDRNYTATKEVRDLFEKQSKKARRECWLRLLAAAFVTVYGALGIKYNTGWYQLWGLFTAMVGFTSLIMIILWYWLIQTKLTILREIKQLRLEVNRLSESKSDLQR